MFLDHVYKNLSIEMHHNETYCTNLNFSNDIIIGITAHRICSNNAGGNSKK